MKIDYISLSNILSFPFNEDISKADALRFDPGLNIVIGENGSGKSTVLEAINFFFRRVLFKQFTFNIDMFARRASVSADERRGIIRPVNQNTVSGFRLAPNWDTQDREQRIRVAVTLDAIDERNISNIRANYEKLERAASSYSGHSIADNGKLKDLYIIDAVLDAANNSFRVEYPDYEPDFGITYLSEYQFLKESIRIHNTLNSDDLIPTLFESFTIISSYRNYHAFDRSITLRDAGASQQIQKLRGQEYDRSLNVSDNSEPPIFALVRLQVAEHHFNLISKNLSDADCEREANSLEFLQSINKRLKTVGLECKIKLVDLRTWQYSFEFRDLRRGRVIEDINSLSAGQKAIIHLVFEAYGRGDLKGGLVIIDEPEIHLHYQFQHEYLQVIDDLNREQNCQYVLVTHSEALINSGTINNVRRFALNDKGETLIVSPQLTSDQKSLIKILDNTRSTFAFFAKKVVLVEGETDKYFFRAVMQELFPQYDQEVAILHITGKGEHHRWRSLFEAFGLEVFFIGDFDSIVDYGFSAERATSLRTKESVVEFKNRNPLWEASICSATKENVFILRFGNLEAYIGTRKDLSEVIIFCNDQLKHFLTDGSKESADVISVMRRITG